MAVQQDFARMRADRSSYAPRLRLARKKLLEEEGLRRELLRCLAGQNGDELVAQGQQARGLQPDDGDASFQVWRGCGKHSPGLGARLLDQARRQKRAPATERPPLTCHL